MNTKKVLLAVLASAGLFALAATALAADYAPVVMASGTAISAQGMPMMGQPPQNMMYYNGMPSPMTYRTSMAQPAMAMAWGSGRDAAWYGLVFVITIVLIWAALLLLIAVLWKILCKHRKG